MPTPLQDEDLEVLARTVTEYFEVAAGDKAQVRTAWLLEHDEPVLREDFNGLIEVSGGFAGSICFSAPQRLLDYLLLASGDNNYSRAKYLDLVGEVANTLSGRARSHFGETLQISPPRAFERDDPAIAPRAEGLPYAIPILWRSLEANLVVHLNRQDGPNDAADRTLRQGTP